jgi:two-component system sensor histidine kinase QseC
MALVWVGTVIVTYFDAREELNEILDAHLTQAAALLIAQTTGEFEEIETGHALPLHKYSRRVAFQIWEHGQLLLHSANAPQTPLASREQGFSDSNIAGQRWRVFSSLDASGKLLIHVAEQAEVRDKLAREVAKNLLYPLLIALPLFAILLWLAVSRGLRPLASLTREVALREPDNLAPLPIGAAPAEVLPLIDRLNHLFERIATSMQNERRFTADAAHELRTPVAAIKAQAQVARGAQDAAERIHALDSVVLGCDRAAHLIEQLLTLARLDSLQKSALEPCDLQTLAIEAIAEMTPLARQKGVQLELAEGEAATVQALPGLLRILLRNLIDNAVRYTPAGTQVQVRVDRADSQPRITVSDNGPGIPVAEREKVLERFYRPLGTGEQGSGLGLSIVQRIAAIHGATLQLASAERGRGLQAIIVFPKPGA